VRHCVATCNATVALELVIRAAGLAGEVIVPAMTFVATAHALSWQQITPVFADIDPQTLTLDPDAVAAAVGPRTTGIIGVHVWGRPCDTDRLAALAREGRLRLLYDASHALGCSHRGRMIGGFGDAEVFSFHATKFVNGFEGGAVVTNDGALAERVRLMKNFGFAGYDDVIHPGTNGKMSEVSAAMTLTSLESMDDFVAANTRNHRRYRDALAGVPGIRVLDYDDGERANRQYVVVDVEADAYGVTRDELLRVLHAENVLARRYFHPGCHRMEPYRSSPPPGGWHLPQTERVVARVLSLPTGASVGAADIEAICGIVRTVAVAAPAIRERLAADDGGAAAAPVLKRMRRGDVARGHR
jgi:dTDP-4-amino-4,6-dideoxygalactose transaminase